MPSTRRANAAEALAKLASELGFVMVAIIADEDDAADEPFLVVRGVTGRDCSGALIEWASDELMAASVQVDHGAQEYPN